MFSLVSSPLQVVEGAGGEAVVPGRIDSLKATSQSESSQGSKILQKTSMLGEAMVEK